MEKVLKVHGADVSVEDEEEAWITAWKTFPEYKELGVFEQGESDI